MYQGQCQYRYELFWLENGQPVTAEVQFFDFDIFNSDHFDTTAILTFLEKVNDYLTQQAADEYRRKPDIYLRSAGTAGG